MKRFGQSLVIAALTAASLAGCGGTTVILVTPAPVIAPLATQAPVSTPAPTTAPNNPNGLSNIVAATVQVFMFKRADDEQPYAGGSGTIVSADGLILTNAHVGAPLAPGLAVQYSTPSWDPAEKLVIAMTQSEDKAPVPMYQASLVAADGYLDVAVLKIDKMADGSPLTGAVNLPFVEVGDSDSVRIGDRVTIVGFPGIGGDTVTVAKGDVSGFITDDRIGDRAWIKTSAIVYHGNSGGLASNDAGQLVGIPTRLPDFGAQNDVGGFSLLRSSKLALPVIEAARSGQAYGDSKYVTPGTGQERLDLVGWLDPADDGCSSADPNRTLPVGTNRIAGGFSWSGFASDEDVLMYWIMGKGNDAQLISTISGRWPAGASGDCIPLSVTSDAGFEENQYMLAFFVGPTLQEIAEATVTTGQVQQPPSGVTLSGRIVDTTTGNGIPSALFVVLKEGTDVDAWVQTGAKEDVASLGQTAANGTFTTDRPVTPGTKYPLVIWAQGYQLWAGTLTPGNQSDLGDIGLAPAQ